MTELNRARERPAEFADDLRRYRATIRGRLSYASSRGVVYQTREGAAAVDEAIAFMERQPALPALADSGLLARAARTLIADQARTGQVGHVSSAGLHPSDRVRAVGGGEYVAETIAYGFDAPAAAVRDLIVDDGVPNRGHRKLIFSAEYRYAGVGCGAHPRFRQACVIDYADRPNGAWPR